MACLPTEVIFCYAGVNKVNYSGVTILCKWVGLWDTREYFSARRIFYVEGCNSFDWEALENPLLFLGLLQNMVGKMFYQFLCNRSADGAERGMVRCLMTVLWSCGQKIYTAYLVLQARVFVRVQTS